MTTYEPQEDSVLLSKYVCIYAAGRVLDIGTGSGVQALAAAEKKEVSMVVACDLFKKPCFSNKKIRYVQSSLFRRINGKYDTILFNPPYLPQEGRKRLKALEGGRKGTEIIQEFLEKAGSFLNRNGSILMVFSSFTGRNNVDEIIRQNTFDYELLEQQSYFFEKLFCYRVFRPSWFYFASGKGIRRIIHFAKGKRGRVYVGSCRGKRVAIKVKNEKSERDTLCNEAGFLEKANKHKIGPKLLFSSKDRVVYEFVRGKYFKDCDEQEKHSVCISILKQARVMDKLGFSKGELHRPLKNIIVKGNKAVLIDFERSRNDCKPKNVTQFCSYLMKDANTGKKELLAACIDYKKSYSELSFQKIMKIIAN